MTSQCARDVTRAPYGIFECTDEGSIGCGKFRTLCVKARFGLNGLELTPELPGKFSGMGLALTPCGRINREGDA